LTDLPSYWSTNATSLFNTNSLNVGIGTDAATRLLHIAQGGHSNAINIVGYDQYTNNYMRLYISPTGAAQIDSSSIGSQLLLSEGLYASGDGTFSGTVTADDFIVNPSLQDLDAVMSGQTETNLFYLDASANAIAIGTATPVAPLTVNGDTVVTGNVAYAGQAYPISPPALTYTGTNVAWDCDSGNVATLTLTNATSHLSAPSNVHPGATYILIVEQDATGSHALGYDSVFLWPGGSAPTITALSNSVDVLTFVAKATNVLLGVSQQAFQ